MSEDVDPIHEIVRRWARQTPGREALRCGARAWTWQEYEQRVLRVASGLTAEGVAPGERIAFYDRNDPAGLDTTLAAAVTGAANVVVNWRLAPDEVAHVLADAEARMVFVGPDYLPVVEQIRGRLPALRRVIVLGGDPDADTDTDTDTDSATYEAWLASHQPAGYDAYAPGPDDCFLQLYTSGTTGFPKGVLLTHRSVGAHTAMGVAAALLGQDSVNLVAMPLFHVGGSCWALLSMQAGGRTVLVRDIDPGAILDTITTERVTHTFFVPALLAFLLQVPDLGSRDLSSLRFLGYGGSPMPMPLLEQCLAAFPAQDLYQVYGLTEVSGVLSLLGPAEHRDPTLAHRRASAGLPVPGIEVRVVGPVTGHDLGPGEIGEFWVRGPQTMAGYWRDPEGTGQAFAEGGWLRTGDAGYLDADGYLYIEDRIKDMIVTGGENVYPAEVERVLAGHPDVAEAAVIGVPDTTWGEAVKAVVVGAPGAVVAPAGLIAYCRDRLAHYKCPSSVDVAESLPRNLTGKVLKRELRAPYWADRERKV